VPNWIFELILILTGENGERIWLSIVVPSYDPRSIIRTPLLASVTIAAWQPAIDEWWTAICAC
jgi:hypothetical protein